MIFCGTVCILYHTGNRLGLINRGLFFNLRLLTEYQKFRVGSACWHSWSEETRRVHVKKLRDYVATFSDEFVKSKNAGKKPVFLNRKRYREPPTVFVEHLEEQQEEVSQDLRLKFVKSSESQTWKAWGSSSQEEIRFSGSNEKRPKIFELHLRKDVPKLVKKCQGKCGRKIEQDFFAVVRSYGESTWTDSNGNEHSKFGSLYIHFERKCLEKFDGDVWYGPTLSFDFSRIKIDSKCKIQLTENEKQFSLASALHFDDPI